MANQYEKCKELYRRWSEAEWSEEDPLRLIKLARELVKICPLRPDAWNALATSIMGVLFPPGIELSKEERRSLQSNQLFWEMVDAFGKEIELAPDESSAPWNRAISLDKAGLFDKAYQDYLRVAEIDRRHPPADEEHAISIDLFLAGKAIYKAGDYQKAVEALKAAIDENGKGDSDIWYYLAVSLEKLGKQSDALYAYKEAANLNPEYERVYLDARGRLREP